MADEDCTTTPPHRFAREERAPENAATT